MIKYKIKTKYSMFAENVIFYVYRREWYFWVMVDYRSTKEKAEKLIDILKKELDDGQ